MTALCFKIQCSMIHCHWKDYSIIQTV